MLPAHFRQLLFEFKERRPTIQVDFAPGSRFVHPNAAE
jgi:hypothetical protein